jgi:glyoxylase-like metal-dependent hydrolase (beta-lactamase superfamily II)
MIAKTLKLSVTNCYLLKAGHGHVLIDTGYDWEWDAFQKQLDRAEVEFADIDYLVLTHHHDDHAGLLNQLVSKNPGIKVALSGYAKVLLAKGRNDRTNGGAYVNKRVNALLSLKKMFDKRWTHTFPPYDIRENDIVVSGSVNLQDLGIDLDGKIIETFGHSDDSISVVLDDGDCFAGDAAANFLQFAGTRHCIIYIEDLEQYYKSWSTLLEAGAKQIYPAHGKPFSAEELRKNINRNRKRDLVLLK